MTHRSSQDLLIDRIHRLPKPRHLPSHVARDTITRINFFAVKEDFLKTLRSQPELPERSKADIICLQETHLLAADAYRLKHRQFSFIFHSHSDQKRAGVSILIKDTVSFHLISSTVDPKGRFIILRDTVNSKQYTILSLYAPNSHQP